MNKTTIGIDITKHKFDVAYCTCNLKILTLIRVQVNIV